MFYKHKTFCNKLKSLLCFSNKSLFSHYSSISNAFSTWVLSDSGSLFKEIKLLLTFYLVCDSQLFENKFPHAEQTYKWKR